MSTLDYIWEEFCHCERFCDKMGRQNSIFAKFYRCKRHRITRNEDKNVYLNYIGNEKKNSNPKTVYKKSKADASNYTVLENLNDIQCQELINYIPLEDHNILIEKIACFKHQIDFLALENQDLKNNIKETSNWKTKFESKDQELQLVNARVYELETIEKNYRQIIDEEKKSKYEREEIIRIQFKIIENEKKRVDEKRQEYEKFINNYDEYIAKAKNEFDNAIKIKIAENQDIINKNSELGKILKNINLENDQLRFDNENLAFNLKESQKQGHKAYELYVKTNNDYTNLYNYCENVTKNNSELLNTTKYYEYQINTLNYQIQQLLTHNQTLQQDLDMIKAQSFQEKSLEQEIAYSQKPSDADIKPNLNEIIEEVLDKTLKSYAGEEIEGNRNNTENFEYGRSLNTENSYLKVEENLKLEIGDDDFKVGEEIVTCCKQENDKSNDFNMQFDNIEGKTVENSNISIFNEEFLKAPQEKPVENINSDEEKNVKTPDDMEFFYEELPKTPQERLIENVNLEEGKILETPGDQKFGKQNVLDMEIDSTEKIPPENLDTDIINKNFPLLSQSKEIKELQSEFGQTDISVDIMDLKNNLDAKSVDDQPN